MNRVTYWTDPWEEFSWTVDSFELVIAKTNGAANVHVQYVKLLILQYYIWSLQLD